MNVVQPIRDMEKVCAIEDYLYGRNRRDWLLFVAGTNSGLRISDLLKLRVEDVGGLHLVVKETKTRKRQFLRINPKLRRAFVECTEGLPDRHFLFRSRHGCNQALSRKRAYVIIREAARHFGLQHIGTHTLRKTFGYHLYQQTKDVALLQDIFGHSSPSVTLRYIGINQDLKDQAVYRLNIGN